jgi:peptidoglycan/LPS O-acetylase OafA/YrhL
MHQAPANDLSGRRADVDSLRVLALALLIVYHVLLVYSGADFWRIISTHNGYWADYLITLLRPWRLSLVFLVGGIAARFMIQRRTFLGFLSDRTTTLLVAFVFAVVVLVPPLRYVTLDSGQDYFGYLIADAWRADSVWGVSLPEFSHAWFLPYLFAYSALAGGIWRFAPGVVRGAQRVVERAPVAMVVLSTVLWFAVVAAVVFPLYPPTAMLPTDVGGHAKFLPVFLFGVVIGKSGVFRARLNALKLPLWGATVMLLPLNIGAGWLHLNDYMRDPTLWHLARGAFGGAMLFSVLAFAGWVLNKPSRSLSYAADAILPVYLLHQAVLVITADHIVDRGWSLPLESAFLLFTTLLAPLAIYHLLVRDNPPLRRLFGLRPTRRRDETPA